MRFEEYQEAVQDSLATIFITTQAVLEDVGLTEEQREWVQFMRESVKDMMEIDKEVE
jgi:hypothetical protein